jgi:4-hydroxybenzoate polyprenyltransferase
MAGTVAAPNVSLGRRDTFVARIVARAPEVLRSYLELMRLHRPSAIWLIVLPGWWSVSLAGDRWPDWGFLVLLLVHGALVRGAGCTVNDIVDRDIDAQVRRTASRPIPSGRVSVRHACVFLSLQIVASIGMILPLGWIAVALMCLWWPLIIAYPYLKRITYWPQAWLGLTFNWYIPLMWIVITGSLDLQALALYGAAFFWTVGYDTIYAHQDRADDVRLGVKSTAILFRTTPHTLLAGCYALVVSLLAVAGWLAGLSWPFFALLIAVASQLAWQVQTLDTDDAYDCHRKFVFNRSVGWLIFMGIVTGKALT